MASRLLRWLRAIVILVLVLAAIGGGGLWLIGQEVALRYVMQRLSAESGGVLQVEGLSGSLYGPLTILSIRFENAERRIVVRELALDWSPTELWHNLLLIHRVSAASIDIIIKKTSDEPLPPPRRLGLPLNVRAGEISLGRLTIVAASGSETQFTDV